MPTVDQILNELEALADPDNAAGMARYAIGSGRVLGVKIPELRAMAKRLGKDHALALALWATDVHEARLLACFMDDSKQVTDAQMEAWAADFASWDICDQCCNNLFARTPWAYEKAVAWTAREPEFVKRAGYVLMATLAVHDKKVDDGVFAAFLPHIVAGADDPRNFVKKAVNWALRQIGKRSHVLHAQALAAADAIAQLDTPSARWIANDARRELTDPKTVARIKR